MTDPASTPMFDFALTTQESSQGPVTVGVSGEVDIFTAPELKAALGAAIDNGARDLIVDLSQTRFMDSTALGVLIGAVKKLRPLDGRLCVVNTEASIAKTFEITGLDRIFTIVASHDDAMALLVK